MTELMGGWETASMSLRNRLWMAPLKTGFGTPEGRITERHLNFYGRIARGGIGLILVEPVPVRLDGREHPRQLAANLGDSVIELGRIVKAVHAEGAKVGLHLNHAGRAANPKASGMEPVAPSFCRCPARGHDARELGPEEIEEIIHGFGSAAAVAEAAGFDLVEVQAGHGYLLSQFLDPKLNRREDIYGKNRRFFAEKVLQAVRQATGLPVSMRVTMNNPDSRDETRRMKGMLKLAAEIGVSFIHASMGDACTNPPWYYHHGALPDAPQERALKLIRSLTGLPLVAAGRMGDYGRAKRFLENGTVDAVALGRPLVADPDLPLKWSRGAFEDVLECGYCLQGCLAGVVKGEGLSCVVNPAVGKAPPPPPKRKRRTLVAGAGPAGLSAALELWRQGHGVIVAEAAPEAGGLFRAAPLSPGKDAMRRPLRSLLHAVERAEIPVVYNQAVDEAFLKKVHPEVLIWAAGGEARVPRMEAIQGVPSMTAREYYLEGKKIAGERVLVLGGGMVGVEAAEKLALEGREVVVVEMLSELSRDMDPLTRKMLFRRLKALDSVTLHTDTMVERVDEKGVTLNTPSGRKTIPPVDAVLVAVGFGARPVPPALEALVPKCWTIGDARLPRNLVEAVREGYEVGAAL
ncbi:MAG: FAD-dependent oxidoreductase [Acidobacteriota bacterium]|jgi:2,4-dienoyl-CoA reductase-like NADH-dependent reductase (Old Yellow Enzyme family)/thioredoxin reductase